MLRTFGDWASLAFLVAVTVYTAIYFARFPWKSSVLTRIFATKNVLVVLYAAQVQASIWLGSAWLGRDWVRVVVNTLCSVAYVALTIAMLWMQKRQQERESALVAAVEGLVGQANAAVPVLAAVDPGRAERLGDAVDAVVERMS